MGAVVFLFILIILVGLAFYAKYYVEQEKKKEAEDREAMGPIASKTADDADAAKEEESEGGEGRITFSDYYLTGGIKTTLCKTGSDGTITCTQREGIPKVDDAYMGTMTGATVGSMWGAPGGPAGMALGAAIGAGVGFLVDMQLDNDVENIPFADQVTADNKFRVDNAGEGQGGVIYHSKHRKREILSL